MTSSQRFVFRGPRRKLVLAFDVGTTCSGVSYSVLDPGQVPEIKSVMRFPGHEQISGGSKIPTIIYYDPNGTVRTVGAEAMCEGIYETAEDKMWTKSEWFKLRLSPKTEAYRNIVDEIPPLPLNKTVTKVLGDFLKYLFQCTADYIKDTHANGPHLWASVENDIDYVLSHPNGWEGIQKTQMKQAAVQAGLIPDTVKDHSRILFVTEGEASLHFSIQNGLPAGAMKQGDGVMIVDAGGGTIDVSAYSRNKKEIKDSFEEIAAPQCYFQGSAFVSIHARLFLEKLLAESQFIDDLNHIVRCFDKTTKLSFRDIEEPQYIKFGSTQDNDATCGIRFGQLKLQGIDVANFFEPSVRSIINAIGEQRKSAHKSISHVVLLGGLAASDWLYHEVLKSFEPLGLNVLRPERHLSKAVSDGAIYFYLDRYVHTRVSRVPRSSTIFGGEKVPQLEAWSDLDESGNSDNDSVKAGVGITGQKNVVTVLLMGMTGTGKSSFIKLLTGNENIKIGHTIESETSEVSTYQFTHSDGSVVALVDTPGFDDNRLHMSDSKVFADISKVLLDRFNSKTVNALVYLHRISDVRFGDTATRNIRMFSSFCGPNAMKNVVILTTRWDETRPDVARKTETDLMKSHFKEFVNNGAQFLRHDNSPSSARNIMSSILNLPPIGQIKFVNEMKGHGLSLGDTAAGRELDSQLTQMRAQQVAEIRALHEEYQEADLARDRARRAEIGKLRDEMNEKIKKVDEDRKIWESIKEWTITKFAGIVRSIFPCLAP